MNDRFKIWSIFPEDRNMQIKVSEQFKEDMG